MYLKYKSGTLCAQCHFIFLKSAVSVFYRIEIMHMNVCIALHVNRFIFIFKCELPFTESNMRFVSHLI